MKQLDIPVRSGTATVKSVLLAVGLVVVAAGLALAVPTGSSSGLVTMLGSVSQGLVALLAILVAITTLVGQLGSRNSRRAFRSVLRPVSLSYLGLVAFAAVASLLSIPPVAEEARVCILPKRGCFESVVLARLAMFLVSLSIGFLWPYVRSLAKTLKPEAIVSDHLRTFLHARENELRLRFATELVSTTMSAHQNRDNDLFAACTWAIGSAIWATIRGVGFRAARHGSPDDPSELIVPLLRRFRHLGLDLAEHPSAPRTLLNVYAEVGIQVALLPHEAADGGPDRVTARRAYRILTNDLAQLGSNYIGTNPSQVTIRQAPLKLGAIGATSTDSLWNYNWVDTGRKLLTLTIQAAAANRHKATDAALSGMLQLAVSVARGHMSAQQRREMLSLVWGAAEAATREDRRSPIGFSDIRRIIDLASCQPLAEDRTTRRYLVRSMGAFVVHISAYPQPGEDSAVLPLARSLGALIEACGFDDARIALDALEEAATMVSSNEIRIGLLQNMLSAAVQTRDDRASDYLGQWVDAYEGMVGAGEDPPHWTAGALGWVLGNVWPAFLPAAVQAVHRVVVVQLRSEHYGDMPQLMRALEELAKAAPASSEEGRLAIDTMASIWEKISDEDTLTAIAESRSDERTSTEPAHTAGQAIPGVSAPEPPGNPESDS